ncbi:hypothetical protein BJ165DRAFT_18075 [Panaeolus papilionaceus]|nr:hypothetical protein BJ165DRAFT_18075 [Panaeolus papilionaceus]
MMLLTAPRTLGAWFCLEIVRVLTSFILSMTMKLVVNPSTMIDAIMMETNRYLFSHVLRPSAFCLVLVAITRVLSLRLCTPDHDEHDSIKTQ